MRFEGPQSRRPRRARLHRHRRRGRRDRDPAGGSHHRRRTVRRSVARHRDIAPPRRYATTVLRAFSLDRPASALPALSPARRADLDESSVRTPVKIGTDLPVPLRGTVRKVFRSLRTRETDRLPPRVIASTPTLSVVEIRASAITAAATEPVIGDTPRAFVAMGRGKLARSRALVREPSRSCSPTSSVSTRSAAGVCPDVSWSRRAGRSILKLVRGFLGQRRGVG